MPDTSITKTFSRDKSPDLDGELWAAMKAARRVRVDLGISPRAPSWGVGCVEYFGGGDSYYAPREDGRLALVVAVTLYGELLDLAAVDLATGQVGTRLGIGWAFNSDLVEARRWGDAGPLALFASPFDYLRAPTKGAYLFEPHAAACKLQGVRVVYCQSAGLARDLHQAFRKPWPVPRLLVPAKMP